jgi:sphingomyelin phosphodiesterase 2
MGDFNSVPTSLPMTIIRDHAQLADAWVESNTEVLLDSTHRLESREAIDRFGVTADSPINTYSAGKWLDDHAREFSGKRLDYVLYRQPTLTTRLAEASPQPVLCCTQTKVVFIERIPGIDVSFSDHFGLEATFEIGRQVATNAPTSNTVNGSGGAQNKVEIGLRSSNEQTTEIAPPTHLTDASIDSVLRALSTCCEQSRVRSRKYLSLFGGSVCLLLATIVGSAWLPRTWANPAVTLLAATTTWFGTTMLYIGFIYGRWEVNALLNVMEELEIYQSSRSDWI